MKSRRYEIPSVFLLPDLTQPVEVKRAPPGRHRPACRLRLPSDGGCSRLADGWRASGVSIPPPVVSRLHGGRSALGYSL
ncbi:hypothetical protein EYF80_060297 [Liparis tanakae]|uniref:Uncharacterized protein n=1 Tax=Liparis tanakae TaxID=230148 RepID=A0A4Z2EM85_9TELE|nr:hypothetical protein EYF80_060297 [Liparis tanakae]